jgi:ketosteroid isomerase-like protein
VSSENVELHARGYDAFNRRDLDAFLALVDASADFAPRSVTVEGGYPYRGLDGARAWWRDFVDAFPDWRIEENEIRDLGELTLARVQLGGHGAGSDAFVGETVWHVMEWRDGKCTRWASFRTEAEAVEVTHGRRTV